MGSRDAISETRSEGRINVETDFEPFRNGTQRNATADGVYGLGGHGMEVRMRTALPVTMVAVMLVAGVGPALAAGTASIDAPAVDHDTASTPTTDGLLVNETENETTNETENETVNVTFGEQVSTFVSELQVNGTNGTFGQVVATFVLANNPSSSVPDHAGPGNETGPPDHAGPGNETGPPEHAGSGNETGPPDDAGPPDDGDDEESDGDDEEDDTDSDSSDDDQDNGNGSNGNNGNG